MSRKKLNSQSTSSYMDPNRRIIYRVGSIAALILVLLLIAAIIPISTIFQDNFLVLIFKLHAGFSGIEEESLEGLHLLDFSILVLVGMMFLALYPILKQVSKAWAIFAITLPFLGLGLYIITQDIGRSGILAAGLVIAFIMLKSNSFSKGIAYLGILANGCMLIADIGIAYGYGKILAVFIGIGYGLVTLWYGLIGWRLFQLSKAGR